jgi:adhesin HecA-like repeat protein
MKRHIGWLTGLLIIMAYGGSANADSDLSLSPISGTFASGTTFNVDVNIANVTDLYGYQFDVTFNPDVLAAVGTSEGSFLSQGGATFFIPGTPDNNNGVLSATADTLLSPVAGVTGAGELAILSFKAIGAGISSITLSGVTLVNSAFDSVGSRASSASVSVTARQMTAPEMDPTWTVSGVTLLLGTLTVIRGRRREIKAV